MLKKLCLFFAVICPVFGAAAKSSSAEPWKKQFANEAATCLMEVLPFQLMRLEQSVFESNVDGFLDRHEWGMGNECRYFHDCNFRMSRFN